MTLKPVSTTSTKFITEAPKHRRVMQYRVRNAAGGYVPAVLAGSLVSMATEMSPALRRRARQPLTCRNRRRRHWPRNAARMLVNASRGCPPSRPLRDGPYKVRVRGTVKLNDLQAEAVDNMLAEYAGRMLSITRGRSRVYRSRSVQFVVPSNDLGRGGIRATLTHHHQRAIFSSCSNRERHHYPRLSCRPGLLRALNQSSVLFSELDRHLRAAGRLAPNGLPIPEIERKSASRTRRYAHGPLSTRRFMRRASAFLKTRRDAAWCIATVDMGHTDCSTNGTDRPRAFACSPMWHGPQRHRECEMGVAGCWGQDDFLHSHPL